MPLYLYMPHVNNTMLLLLLLVLVVGGHQHRGGYNTNELRGLPARKGKGNGEGKWGRDGDFHFLLPLRAVSVSVSVSVSVLASCYRLPINSVPALAIVDFIDASAAAQPAG